ncbi:Zinc finger CCCH domain-containing protein 19 [Platanthera zijinensis]|uniref:Zinc finger CCCH domain-containing protein 19 n=1 Tax=Platanthera zijinensis TaxID=2320716 RepID=A0AAP0AWA5_9ASPA
MLEAVIQNTLGPLSPKKLSVCEKCKDNLGFSVTCPFSLFCDNVSDGTPMNSSSPKKFTYGKLTKKDLGLHKLVFMDGILPQGTEVGYYLRGKRLLEGYIKDSGIFCRCCSNVLSPSQFEAHAGQTSRRKPYNNIYTSNGVSLHELSVSLSKGRRLSSTENDDLCRICADGGDLLLCDLCPRAFHKECVGLSSIPIGDWFCPYCQNLHQKDKCLANSDNAIAAGRVTGVDSIEQIIKRCIRIVSAPVNDAGVCALCRVSLFLASSFNGLSFFLQCEIEYHVGCLKDHGMAALKELPEGEWFCRPDCRSIHSTLHELLRQGPEALQEFDANIIRTKLGEIGLNKDATADVRWRLLSGRSDYDDSKLLLSQAVSIFRESFDPIIDPISGRDLMPSMVYGKNMRRQDYGGVYCMVLTLKSSVISAALLRVLGCEVAELPLVATKRERQGMGYFQSLFSCIESLLKFMKVKHFVLPAADDTESMWINKFGFTKLMRTELLEHVKNAPPIIFQGTSMLHKLVGASLAG